MRILQEVSEQNPDDLRTCRFNRFQSRIRKLKFPILVSFHRILLIPRNNPMRKILITILLSTVLCAVTFTTASHGQDKRSKSFLSNFQVGQIVLVSEPHGSQITPLSLSYQNNNNTSCNNSQEITGGFWNRKG